MANQVEQAVDLQQKAVDLIDQMTNGLKAAAPQMGEIMLKAIWIEGVVNVVFGFALAAIAVTGGILAYRSIRKLISIKYDGFDPDKDESDTAAALAWMITIVGAAASFIIGIVVLNWMADVQMWAAAIDPRVGLALKVLAKIGA